MYPTPSFGDFRRTPEPKELSSFSFPVGRRFATDRPTNTKHTIFASEFPGVPKLGNYSLLRSAVVRDNIAGGSAV